MEDSIQFSDPNNIDQEQNPKKKLRYKDSLNDIMLDVNTQNTFFEIFNNYHKFLGNMISTCSNLCIKEFHHKNLNVNEEICVRNCQNKFFTTYALGENYLKTVAKKTENTDIFSDIGYVVNNQNQDQNSINNSILWGKGIALDYVTYYDKLLRLLKSKQNF